MPAHLLLVTAVDPSFKRSALEVRGAKKWFTRELANVATSEGTEAPFTLSVTFKARPDLDETLAVVRGAFEEAAVKRGEFKVAFSEDGVVWHEGVVVVGAAAAAPQTTVSLTLYTQVTISDLDEDGFPADVVVGVPIGAGFAALAAAVRAAVPGLSDVVVLSDGAGLCGLMRLPAGTPPPSAATLEAAVQAASADAGVVVVGSDVGAYVGSWDRTLFRSVKGPSSA